MNNYTSGAFEQHKYHKSFLPNPINKAWEITDQSLIVLLGDARSALGRLDMFSKVVPNLNAFIFMHTLKEATESSKIEGTQTNIEEALLPKESIAAERRDDWEEVQNYISAMKKAQELLETLPFSTRMFKALHATLLQGVRGEHKLPGEFRTSQNWIGGSSINDATFVPPAADMVHQLMGDLEEFANNDDLALDHLVKIAMIHYQFETIHPFLDGNGRVGRLMIPIYLQNNGLLTQPILYMSDFFEKNRAAYYDKLMAVRTRSDIVGWLKFFLNGVVQTSTKGSETLEKILKLEKDNNEKIYARKNSDKLLKVVKVLYGEPMIRVEKVEKLLEVSTTTAYKYVNELVKLNILEKSDKGYYAYNEYINLFL